MDEQSLDNRMERFPGERDVGRAGPSAGGRMDDRMSGIGVVGHQTLTSNLMQKSLLSGLKTYALESKSGEDTEDYLYSLRPWRDR